MRTLPLSKGYVALVDNEDYAHVSHLKWYAVVCSNTVYARHNVPRAGRKRAGSLSLHRVILGVTDPKVEVDHKNGNGLDCQKHNLRKCTHSQNQKNQRKTRGSSQYKGVSWNKADRRWEAKIENAGFTIHLGRYKIEKDAALAYDVAARKHFGEFAHTNF